MAAKKKSEIEIICSLFKDRNLLYAHGFFYVLMFIICWIFVEFSRGYSKSFSLFIDIFLIATLSVQVVLFLSMLIKLFTKPNTHQLTSFWGLFIGIFICLIWFGILIAYFNFNSWGLEGIIVMLLIFLPCVSSIAGYILLIFIKAVRKGIYLLINKYNSENIK